MRYSVALLAVVFAVAGTAQADEILVAPEIQSVVVYPGGAWVSRSAKVSIPAGDHQLILTGLPKDAYFEGLRIDIDGVRRGAVTTRNDFVPPQDPARSQAVTNAEAEIERIETLIRTQERDQETILLEVEAAEARKSFVAQLGRSEGMAALPLETLRDLAGLVGTETLAADRAAQAAEIRAEMLDQALDDLAGDLEAAEAALAALRPGARARSYVAVQVTADVDTEAVLRMKTPVEWAGWEPVYDIELDPVTGAVSVERGVKVFQNSGENWEDIRVMLSTASLSGRSAPGFLPQQLYEIFDEPEFKPLSRVAQAPVMEEMAMGVVEDTELAPRHVAGGLVVEYALEGRYSIADRADALRLSLGQLSFDGKVTAQAVPRKDQTAFIVAEFTNSSAEPILPGDAFLYVDGTMTGSQQLELLVAGDSTELGFGPINGIRLERRVLDRNTGGAGFISRNNERREEAEITVSNLTGRAWDLRLIDRVPYSEQEDLVISYQAEPAADVQDLDGRKGVLAWDFTLQAGAKRTVQLRHTITWPLDKLLR
jgi:uncharacterized protein (TIGR02231 family)